MQCNSLQTEGLRAEIMGQNGIIRVDKIDFQNVQRIAEFCSLIISTCSDSFVHHQLS